MERTQEKQIPIWFFIGAIVLIYGFLVLGAGIYGWSTPPGPESRVKLWELHADVWWGILLLVIGFFYVVKFWPWSGKSRS